MARKFLRSGSNYFTTASAPTTSDSTTVACFAKYSGTTGGFGSNQRVMHLGTVASGHTLVSIILDESTPAFWYQSFDGGNALITGSAIKTNQWYHVAAVRTSDSQHQLFKNGVSEGTDTSTHNPSAPDRLRVGAYINGDFNQNFDGDVAELAIWNVALTQGEVMSLSRGKSPLKVRPTNLVFYCPMNRIGDEFDQVQRLILTQNGVPLRSAHPYVEPPIPKQRKRYKAAAGGGGSIFALQHIHRFVAGIGA